MATIKSYTDISQSKKLAEILPLESADMFYVAGKGEPIFIGNKVVACGEDDYDALGGPDVICWSLAALLEQLPYELCDDDGNSSYLQMNKEEDVYQLVYTDPYGDFESIETDRYEEFVDACYNMILKLNESNLL